ncbi:MAG: hypothetical protein IKW20_06490 [Bacteroidales bacterium]|nr:hypothetical protein [Bacteroidales bacterium]
MKNFLLYIWQLPQNIVGLLFLLFIRGEERHSLDGITFYEAESFNGGISLGKYIIVYKKRESTIRHEYGHCIQSRMLGPLYLLIVGIPSLIWASMYGVVISHKKYDYSDFWCERWADRLGGVRK